MPDLIRAIRHPQIPPLPRGSHYDSRTARSRFVASHFRSILTGRVLDVGCFERDLQAAIGEGVEYVGVDLHGRPDVRFDLESGPLPFEDGSFEVAVCTDVLEHLEKIHFVFDELLRVSRRHVIVSLPNCWHGNWRWVLPWRASRSGKYYGIPPDIPRDRHRWFFNTCEAAEFIHQRAGINGARVVWQDFILPQSRLNRALLRLAMGRSFLNWAPAVVWAVVERGGPA